MDFAIALQGMGWKRLGDIGAELGVELKAVNRRLSTAGMARVRVAMDSVGPESDEGEGVTVS